MDEEIKNVQNEDGINEETAEERCINNRRYRNNRD